MAFLSRIADWAEKHIPLVGSYISRLVEDIEDAIEDAWGWLKDEVNYISDVWVPWAERQFSRLSSSLSQVENRITRYIEPALNGLRDDVRTITTDLSGLKDTVENLLANFGAKVWEVIPDWLKEGAEKALNEIPQLWNSLTRLWGEFEDWLSYKERWFLEQLNRAKSIIEGWIYEAVRAVREWAEAELNNIKSDLHRAEVELRNDLMTAKRELSDKLSAFEGWVEEKLHNTENAILHIDEYILTALAGFILAMLKWFLASFIDDLAHLQYDPETKRVYGRPKNPITVMLIWFFEVEKPENPYKSVKPELGVRE